MSASGLSRRLSGEGNSGVLAVQTKKENTATGTATIVKFNMVLIAGLAVLAERFATIGGSVLSVPALAGVFGILAAGVLLTSLTHR